MKKYKNKNWLCRKYIEERLSLTEIGKTCKVCHGVIVYWMKKFNIPRRTQDEGKKIWDKNHPEALRGSGCGSWKGGRIKTVAGYIYVYQPDHPRVTTAGYVLEHRLVMEKKVGRHLHSWETVHHINGIKDDNRIENLQLLPGQGLHNTQVEKVYKENQFIKGENQLLKQMVVELMG